MTVVAIDTFSLPATDLNYPAITICNRNRYDVGEYIRSLSILYSTDKLHVFDYNMFLPAAKP